MSNPHDITPISLSQPVAPIELSMPDALAASGLTINETAGTINNVAFITRGPAKGHGFDVDDTMLQQVAAAITRRDKVTVRLTHPADGSFFNRSAKDPIEVLVGHASNARVVGDRVRGDIQLGTYAKHSPSGDLYSYLLSLAKEAPGSIGLSITFIPAPFESRRDASNQSLPPAGRVRDVLSVDFVGTPAANPTGLLSSPPPGSEGITMPPEKTPAPASTSTTAATEPVQLSTPTPAQPDAVTLAERTRVTQLQNLGAAQGLSQAWVNSQISKGRTLAEATEIAVHLKEFRNDNPAVPLASSRCSDPHGLVTGGDDGRDSLTAGMVEAIAMRHGTIIEKPVASSRVFHDMQPVEMCRALMNKLGVRTDGMSRSEIVRNAWSRERLFRLGVGEVALAHGTSDFPSVVAAGIRTRMRMSYTEAPSSWPRFAKRITVPDFEEHKFLSLGSVPTPPEVKEGAEYRYKTFSEQQEKLRIKKHGQLMKLTWELVLADRLGAFFDQAQKFAVASKRIEDDAVFAELTSNPAMLEDDVALFHANHNNLNAGGASVPDLGSLKAARTALALQQGPGAEGADLNLTAAHLLVPIELQDETEKLVSSLIDPTANNDTKNLTFLKNLKVTANPRLSRDSATAWYMLASAQMIDTIVIAFLDSEPAPVVEEDEEFTRDARTIKVRHSCGAKALDFRGMQKNDGAGEG